MRKLDDGPALSFGSFLEKGEIQAQIFFYMFTFALR